MTSATPSFVGIRGYCIPFGRATFVAQRGVVEVVDHGAFDKMLATNKRVPITWDSHDEDAMILAREATLFADDYGLGFFASANMRTSWGLIAGMTQRTNPADECSIGGLAIAAEHHDTVEGIRCLRMTEATFDHVSICRDAAYGRHTAAWPTHLPIEDAPWRIQQMAARWEQGNAAANLKKKRSRLLDRMDAVIRAAERTDDDLDDDQFAEIKARAAEIRAIDRDLAAIRRRT